MREFIRPVASVLSIACAVFFADSIVFLDSGICFSSFVSPRILASSSGASTQRQRRQRLLSAPQQQNVLQLLSRVCRRPIS